MRNTPPSHGRYRSEIDGLRAIAVLSVIFFHCGVPGFTGGFAGVDVFFVISGYLITQTLLERDHRHLHALAAYYERRIRRIIPALFVVLLFCTIMAAWLFWPIAFMSFSESLAATALFASNFLFLHQSGYFDTASHLKPLLHTWSLAVEEQFYLLYPAFLAPILSRFPGRLALFLLVAGSASFLAGVAATAYWPQAAFFLTPSRAWEVLLGCYFAVGPVAPTRNGAVRELVSLAGLVAITAAFFVFTTATPFPGTSALLPCAGAAFFLHVNANSKTFAARLLSWGPLVAVGRISYSLYLWHWPLLAFWRSAFDADPSPLQAAAIIAAAFALAAISWRFVEQPFRRPGGVVSGKILFRVFGAATACIVAFGIVGRLTDGMLQRYSPPVAAMLRYQAYIHSPEFRRAYSAGLCFDFAQMRGYGGYDWERCFTARPGSKNILLWGDSHAAHFSLALDEFLSRHGAHLMQATMADCRPYRAATNPAKGSCASFNDAVLQRLESQKADAVLISAAWVRDQERPWAVLDERIATLRMRGIAVFLLGPMIQYRDPLPLTLARAMMAGKGPASVAPSLAKEAVLLDRQMRARYAAMPGVTYVSLPDALCSKDRCPVITDAHAPIQFDDVHLTLAGAHYEMDKLTTGPLRPLLAAN